LVISERINGKFVPDHLADNYDHCRAAVGVAELVRGGVNGAPMGIGSKVGTLWQGNLLPGFDKRK
jgi:hypothetical protein